MGDAGDVGLRRREFLERTAYAAGLAGMAMLPAGTLLSEAAKAQATPLPDPAQMGLDHIVVVMMENRSFDHYFGWLDGADGIQSQTFLDPQGNPVDTIHFEALPGEADHQGCGFSDPGHGWNSGRAQLRDGFMAEGSGNDMLALTYFNEGDLGFIHDAGKAYTVYDRFFCSTLTSTWPNRYFNWSAQSGGRMDNSPPVETLGNQWETIFDRAIAKGRTARYYNSDLPFSAVWGARGLTWTLPLVQYYVDCALGTLPNISFVDPPFRDGGGFDGNSADEHPHGDVRLGQAWMADMVSAFVNSPNYRKGALFVVYDEWGGFFDHVTPPSVPDNLQSPDLDTDFGQMGFRIPSVCVSPWTRNTGSTPRVDHGVYGFESILKLISYRWGLGTLEFETGVPNLRHQEARNIGLSFDWANPVLEAPDLPDPTHIVSKPCSLGGGDLLPEDAQAHESDLADLAHLAEHLGFDIGDSRPEDLFTKPDSVRRALRAAG
jgi:phospholipase C